MNGMICKRCGSHRKNCVCVPPTKLDCIECGTDMHWDNLFEMWKCFKCGHQEKEQENINE